MVHEKNEKSRVKDIVKRERERGRQREQEETEGDEESR